MLTHDGPGIGLQCFDKQKVNWSMSPRMKTFGQDIRNNKVQVFSPSHFILRKVIHYSWSFRIPQFLQVDIHNEKWSFVFLTVGP